MHFVSNVSKSQLHINYDESAPEDLVSLLLQGEHEWLQNAPATYGDDSGSVWLEDIYPRLLSGTLQDIDLEDLQLYASEFLEKMSVHPLFSILISP